MRFAIDVLSRAKMAKCSRRTSRFRRGASRSLWRLPHRASGRTLSRCDARAGDRLQLAPHSPRAGDYYLVLTREKTCAYVSDATLSTEAFRAPSPRTLVVTSGVRFPIKVVDAWLEVGVTEIYVARPLGRGASSSDGRHDRTLQANEVWWVSATPAHRDELMTLDATGTGPSVTVSVRVAESVPVLIDAWCAIVCGSPLWIEPEAFCRAKL